MVRPVPIALLADERGLLLKGKGSVEGGKSTCFMEATASGTLEPRRL